MGTERVEIVVSSKGTRTVKRDLEDVGKSGSVASKGVGLLQKALLALGGVALIRQVLQLADAFTTIQNKIKNVTASTAQLNVVSDELFTIANETRQSIEAVATVYSRTALAVQELGRSQRETLDFTRRLNQAVELSGASSNEASAALIQLSQGLSAGALRGEELNSVMEQLPIVAKVIAEGLGVSIGELRKMGQEGKITADIIFDAFEKADSSLNEKFANTVPTIGKAFTRLKNEVILLTGEFFKNSGAGDAIARSIVFIAEHARDLFRSLEDVSDIAVATFDVIRESFASLGPIIGPILEKFTGSFELSFRDILLASASVADSILGVFGGLANSIVAIFEKLPAAIKGIFLEIVRSVTKTVLDGINNVIAQLNKIPKVNIDFIEFNVGEAQDPAAEFGRSVADAFNEGFKQSTSFTDFTVDVLKRADARKVERQLQRNQDITEGNAAREELNTPGRSPDATPEQLAIRRQLLVDIKGPQEELANQQKELNTLFEEGEITLQQYNLATEQLKVKSLSFGTTAVDGFRRGFAAIKADILDVSKAAEDVLVNAFNSAEDALVQFVKTGEFNFSSFVDSILADLTKLLARQALASLLNAFSGGGGGALSGLLSSFGGARAEGGPVQAGRSFLVGERGPELFTPSTGGRITSNEQMRGEPPVVNVQVVNVQNEDEVPSAMAGKEGDRTIINSVTRNRTAIRNALGIA